MKLNKLTTMLSKLLAFISSAESVSVGMLSSLSVLHFQRSSSIWSFVSFVSPNAPWQRGKVSFSSVKLTTDRNNAGSNQQNLVTYSTLFYLNIKMGMGELVRHHAARIKLASLFHDHSSQIGGYSIT